MTLPRAEPVGEDHYRGQDEPLGRSFKRFAIEFGLIIATAIATAPVLSLFRFALDVPDLPTGQRLFWGAYGVAVWCLVGAIIRFARRIVP
jgi:hypothetical protein